MSDIAGRRISPRRPLELVAACMDVYGKDGLKVAVTIATPEQGMIRRVFECGPTQVGLVRAIRDIADWLERDYVKAVPQPLVVHTDTAPVQTFGPVPSSPKEAAELT